jgi:hypothetical protein
VPAWDDPELPDKQLKVARQAYESLVKLLQDRGSPLVADMQGDNGT